MRKFSRRKINFYWGAQLYLFKKMPFLSRKILTIIWFKQFIPRSPVIKCEMFLARARYCVDPITTRATRVPLQHVFSRGGVGFYRPENIPTFRSTSQEYTTGRISEARLPILRQGRKRERERVRNERDLANTRDGEKRWITVSEERIGMKKRA